MPAFVSTAHHGLRKEDVLLRILLAKLTCFSFPTCPKAPGFRSPLLPWLLVPTGKPIVSLLPFRLCPRGLHVRGLAGPNPLTRVAHNWVGSGLLWRPEGCRRRQVLFRWLFCWEKLFKTLMLVFSTLKTK